MTQRTASAASVVPVIGFMAYFSDWQNTSLAAPGPEDIREMSGSLNIEALRPIDPGQQQAADAHLDLSRLTGRKDLNEGPGGRYLTALPMDPE
ncbi:MAG: hypothetical protein CMP07_11050 [Xanthomonadales bacterium]|nr:hypothetical protein [Xanthomonadales bacterium]